MKKVSRIFLLFFMMFALVGCNKEATVSNVINTSYIDVKDANDVIYNTKLASNGIKGINFDGVIEVKGKEYALTGKIILGETIYDSIINVNYKKNSLYVKNGKVYLSYYYNNTNVIVKDSLDNFMEEVFSLLDSKNIKYNKEQIVDIIKNKTLNDVDEYKLTKYIINEGKEYSFKYKKYDISLNDKYLVKNLSYNNSKVKVSLNFNYDKVSIRIPLGYDILTINIKDLKELLKIDNVSDLIR